MSSISFYIEKNYLALPVSRFVGNRSLRFFVGGELLDDISLRLDFVSPGHTSYYDVGRFKGETITVQSQPEIELDALRYAQTDEIPQRERYGSRPDIHFTASYGWLNDPNGLFVYTPRSKSSPCRGRTMYHLFYQHNPYDWVWGNMHWGHAVSEDLFRWHDLGDALYPDENGTMFSGSAIVDYDNRSGLKTGDEDVILLFYTCAGNTSLKSSGKRFTQNIAYSNDGGFTFKKYESNPVLEHIAAENRDPKVVWCEETGKFIMAIYLEGNDYCLLSSDNLLDWSELQRLTVPGEAECPDIYPINVVGTNERKWVFSGASHHYIIGDMRGGKFEPCSPVRVLSHGDSSYAAQTFSYPKDERRIQVAWDRFTSFGDDPICGQMGIPCSISLRVDGGEYYLCANPVSELDNLRRTQCEAGQLTIKRNEPYIIPLGKHAYELEIKIGSVPAKMAGHMTIELFGQKIALDLDENTLRVGDRAMPMSTETGCEVRLIADKGSIEAYVNGGRAIMTCPCTLDFNMRYCRISSDEDAVIEKLRLNMLLPCKNGGSDEVRK